ncbi:MAG: DNA integrity scanning protein DisA nucleotide-binding domain protein [Candidatus Vogelbacteria bacterium]|nr:DNA integrity scanning protein DisA nucleotide-binding domain protein [Candidatus Vogelbacteria bacterium]
MLETVNWSILGFSTVIDIAIVAFLLYSALILLRRTHSIVVFRGILALFVVYLIATYFNLLLTHALFQFFFSFFIIIFVVVFQREMRRFFEEFSISIKNIFIDERPSLDKRVADEISGAIEEMAQKRRGALIVMPGKQEIERHLEGGYYLNGEISKPLVLSIFDPSSPGHDGALIVTGDQISRFAAQLPLAMKPIKERGTRHRAALGLSERTDSLNIVVSEERGTVSVAHFGKMNELKNASDIGQEIEKFYRDVFGKHDDSYIVSIFKDNWKEKLLSIALAILLWFVLVHK